MTVVLRIPGTSHSPELAFHVNPTYALYHWLRANANQPGFNDDRLRQAFQLVGRSLNRPGPRGMAAPWEEALATGESPDASLRSFQARVQATGEDMVTAMRIAERIFLEEYWPERKGRIDRALDGIRLTLAPAFPAMAKEHADLLDLDWPPTIDTHLVADLAGHQGAHSHPLTIEVGHHSGLMLFETILHEATHIADVNGRMRGHVCLGDRLQAYLAEQGLSPTQRFNVWHAVIFASSAACTRHHISLDHEDYATSRNLYTWFGVPDAADIWRTHAEKGRDEGRLRQALLDDFRSAGATGR